jgi:hypothetical protein
MEPANTSPRTAKASMGQVAATIFFGVFAMIVLIAGLITLVQLVIR